MLKFRDFLPNPLTGSGKSDIMTSDTEVRMSEKTYTQIISHSLYPAAMVAAGRTQERLIWAIAEDLGLNREAVRYVVRGGR